MDLLHSLNLSDKIDQAATTWCQAEGEEGIEDLMDETYAQEQAVALRLPRIKDIKANKLVNAIKNS